ncbi:MAG TPA: hypothetical protein VN493_28520 [Thermoanaerobaculia bacterium]|nr:hypothetical protein [Thermoanaerobaculia bacterium]
MRILILAACLLLAFQVPALAQTTCVPTDKIGECWNKVQEAALQEARSIQREEAQTETFQELASKATGLNDLVAGSATEDFLPALRFALAAAGLQTDGNDTSLLNFDYKIPLGKNSPFEAKIESKVNDAEVFEPLKMAFREDIRDDRVATLKEGLDDLADYTLALNINRKSEQHGRAPNDYYRWAFGELYEVIAPQISFADAIQAADTFQQILLAASRKNQAANPTAAPLNANSPLSQVPPDLQQEVLTRMTAAAKSLVQATEGLRQALEANGVFKLASLMNNQPQAQLSATYHAREDVAGPDEISGELRYEYDFSSSLNDLRKECAGKSGTGFFDCYQAFINQASVKADTDHGDRLSISADYEETRPFRFSLPEDGVDLNLEAATNLSITATYGRLLDLQGLGDSSRFDFSWTYEDVSDDPNRRDRSIASLTFSNRMLRSLGLSLGLSYANHAKFLPDTDEELSTHFGISYRMFSEEAE